MRISNFSLSKSNFCKKQNNNTGGIKTNNPICEANALNILAKYNKAQINFKSTGKINIEQLKSLNIPNMQIIENDCVRGESLSSKKNRRFIHPVKESGVEQIVDLREKYSSLSYQDICDKQGLLYHHIPIDSSSVDDREIISKLPELFNALTAGKTYIACAQGLHRTDIALALNYIFNPIKPKTPPIMYGHFRDFGFKTDDISRRINSIKKEITLEDIEKLGWEKEIFDLETNTRKKELFDFNSDYYKKL